MKSKRVAYEIEIVQLKSTIGEEQRLSYEKYKFKDKGYLAMHWYWVKRQKTKHYHGLITVEELKNFIGKDNYPKFCQGQTLFIVPNK